MSEHGGPSKHEVVAWLPMPMDKARQLERRVKTAFHDCRVTDGNEIFALAPARLDELLRFIAA